MSRGRMTYAPLYFEDFKKGCEDLSNEQIGAYLRVLFEIYEAMGPIEFDDRKLGKRLNARPHKARSLVENLISQGKLYLLPSGQISNHRAEDEIMKYVSISVQNQLNANSNRGSRNSTGKKANDINKSDERSLSGRSHILNKKNNTSLEVEELPPRANMTAEERRLAALEGFNKRKRQRSGKLN